MKIGLLGFGAMGKVHAYCSENLKYFFADTLDQRIVSVCTAHKESAEEASKRYRIPSYTTNEDEILNDPAIDTVDICTPNIYHYETVKKAILNGKNVYCEKPLAVTYEQAKELFALAKEKNVICQVVFHNRFLLPILKAKEILDKNELGDIFSFSFRFLHASSLDHDKIGWKQRKEICGGGVLFDLGSHIIDLCRYLLGDFSSVIGKSQIVYPVRQGNWKTDADESFYMIASLTNGARGTMEMSKMVAGANDGLSFEIHGEYGSLSFDLNQPNFLNYYSVKTGGTTQIACQNRYDLPGGVFPSQSAPIGWLMGHLHSYHAFVVSVLHHTEASPSFEDGAYVQKVMECAYRSDTEGREVFLEELP